MPFITKDTIKSLPTLLLHRDQRSRFLNRLALDPGSWPSVQRISRLMLSVKPFVCSAREIFGEWSSQDIIVDVAQGFFPCNPCVVTHNDSLYCVLRTVNYRLDGKNKASESSTEITQSKNILLVLDENLQVKSVGPIAHPPGLDGANYTGLEDLRLVSYRGTLWTSYTVADRHPSGIRQMGVSRLSEDGVIDEVRLQQFEGYKDQKNWMPFVHQEELGWVYQCSPLVLLKYDHGSEQALEWRRWGVRLNLEHQRGSSQLIPWRDGWLCVSHEALDAYWGRRYLHRFLEFGPDFALRRLTDPFYFDWNGVEFCAGLCHAPNKAELLVSYGVEDRSARIGRLPVDAVEGQLRDLPESYRLPDPQPSLFRE